MKWIGKLKWWSVVFVILCIIVLTLSVVMLETPMAKNIQTAAIYANAAKICIAAGAVGVAAFLFATTAEFVRHIILADKE